MPEVNQYTFSNAELLDMLIKQAGVHEGRWTLLTNFAITSAHMGPTPDKLGPGLAIIIASVGIQRAPEDAPAETVRDAARVNPKTPKGKRV